MAFLYKVALSFKVVLGHSIGFYKDMQVERQYPSLCNGKLVIEQKELHTEHRSRFRWGLSIVSNCKDIR